MNLAKKELDLLTKWEKWGFINIPVLRQLLQADYMSISKPAKEQREVLEAYDKAIVMASRLGLSFFAALANERAALHSLKADPQGTMDYAGKAITLMEEWGARGRVRFLVKFYDLDDASYADIRKKGKNLRGKYLTSRGKLEEVSSRHRNSDWMSKSVSRSSATSAQRSNKVGKSSSPRRQQSNGLRSWNDLEKGRGGAIVGGH